MSDDGPRILRQSQFIARSSLDDAQRDLIRRRFAVPEAPPALKARRTRHVNGHPEVKAGRARAAAAVACAYEDTEKAVAALERALGRGEDPADVARQLLFNPARFGRWYGDAYPEASGNYLPDPAALSDILVGLKAALAKAANEALRRYPDTVEPRGSNRRQAAPEPRSPGDKERIPS